MASGINYSNSSTKYAHNFISFKVQLREEEKGSGGR